MVVVVVDLVLVLVGVDSVLVTGIGKFSSCLHDNQIANMHTSQVTSMYEGYGVTREHA